MAEWRLGRLVHLVQFIDPVFDANSWVEISPVGVPRFISPRGRWPSVDPFLPIRENTGGFGFAQLAVPPRQLRNADSSPVHRPREHAGNRLSGGTPILAIRNSIRLAGRRHCRRARVIHVLRLFNC
jgi:hypothetical protein